MLEVRPLALSDLPALAQLFSCDRLADGCWCMWFIIRVKEFHAGGSAANAAKFKELAAISEQPLGVVAYLDGEAVGWAAVGPRSRYVRAVRTPTMKSIDPSESDDVWLVPCFFVRPDCRKQGIVKSMLAAAVDLARRSNASAIEGFPASGDKPSSTDRQVGTERQFESCDFRAVHRPSSKRVIMRLDL
jgi:GNAT superfamily N-acetyltransferase